MNLLTSNGSGGAPSDFYSGQNVLSLVLEVDKTLLAPSALLTVWGSTNN